ncbi:Stromal membrane-associated protein 1 [Merluccius polli]|uniref:Stromal membrane-associated protein 1 n=1 Tax=Merluccius polli TaxID=89951 RepID=A0AA47MI97_MERPO|nr:Stromal membrane-associated protein 1 [Merluccius polli]
MKEERREDGVKREDRKRAELQSDFRASPRKSAEPSVDLLGLDAPENSAGSGTGGGTSATGGSAPISDDLDIFGPMVSNPLPSSGNTQSSQADPANSSSTTTTTKAEEKKTLSKDSILSLYATSSMAGQTQSQHQPAAGQAGMYMGQPQMQYATPGFNGGMGGGAGMMPSMAVPNGGYMAMGQGMLPPGAAQGQGMYAMPQQPAQWNMNQMTQQMSTMAAGGGAGAGGAALGAPGAFSQGGAPSPMAGWSAPPTSGQTLSTQLWK